LSVLLNPIGLLNCSNKFFRKTAGNFVDYIFGYRRIIMKPTLADSLQWGKDVKTLSDVFCCHPLIHLPL
jgi:hypothetical protein